MAQVPVFNTPEVKATNEPIAAQGVKADASAFGVSGLDDVGKGMLYVSKALQERQEDIDKSLVTDASNKLAEFQLNLHDPEKGFYAKKGKDALGQSDVISADYDKVVQDSLNSMQSKAARAAFQDIADKTKFSVLESVYAYEEQQGGVYRKQIMLDGVDVNTKLAIANRNNPDKIAKSIANIKSIIEANERDPEQKKLLVNSSISSVHSNVLRTLIGENSRSAKDYLNKHLSEISAEDQPSLIAAVKTNDVKFQAQDLTNNILSKKLPEESALKEVNKIKDLDVREQVESNIKGEYSEKRRFKEEKERAAAEKGWALLEQNPTYANIPADADVQTRISMKRYVKGIQEERESAANKIKKEAQDEKKLAIWNQVYNLSIDNPAQFKTLDLMKYRGYLSNSEYKEFRKLQQKADKPEDYTQIVSNGEKIKEAINGLGLKNDKAKSNAFKNYTQELVTEFEKQHGRKATDAEIQNIIGTLGYKTNHPGWEADKTFDAFGKGLARENDFIKNVINDARYFEKQHNRQPSPQEFDSIIYKRSKMTQKEIREENKQKINQVYLTTPQLKDYGNYIPALNKRLGTNFEITSGFRKGDPQTHGKGLGADVGMNGKSKEQKIAFFKSELNNPNVKKIGTSDPEIIAVFKGHPKLKDESAYDKANGTNHINHAHVTLNTGSGENSIVRMKAPNGKIYDVPANRVAEYKKAGGRIL